MADTLKKISPSYFLRPRGKNLKFTYYIRCWIRNWVPRTILQRKKNRLLKDWENRSDADIIRERVLYYNKLVSSYEFVANGSDDNIMVVADIVNAKNVYYRDTFEIVRYFAPNLPLTTAFGDNTSIPVLPSICKSRPIDGDNAPCVLLNLDKVRHFIFLKDRIDFANKYDLAIFRGACHQNHRVQFMEKFFDHPMVDCGDTGRPSPQRPGKWQRSLITLYDHLKYKFILALEGNDVASNLKWIMSSNSVAVMPRPKYETWFMEGKLLPNIHYIEIKDDYSDLEEKLRYFLAHPDEARTIAKNANAWCEQFQNPERELLISLLVMEKYFAHVSLGKQEY